MTTQYIPVLWTETRLRDCLGRQLVATRGRLHTVITRIEYSPELCAAGALYIPILSAKSALHRHSLLALTRGSSALLTTEPPDSFPESDAFILQVRNIATALALLARSARLRFTGKVIGITGSVGKTTTKDLTVHLLSHVGLTHYTPLNLNGSRVISTSVASLPHSADYSVMEASMVKSRDLLRKLQVIRPDIGVVTSIGHSHGEHHPDQNSILQGKMQIASMLTKGGTMVLPSQSPHFERMKEYCIRSDKVARLITAGVTEQDDVQLLDRQLFPGHSCVTARIGKRTVSFTLGQPGAPFVENALLALGVIHALDIHPDWILHAFQNFVPTDRRMHRYRIVLGGKTFELLDDAYNAAPDSMKAFLSYMQTRTPRGKKILVLGDMLELGADAPTHHQELIQNITAVGADTIILVGPLMHSIAPSLNSTCEVVLASSVNHARDTIKNRLGDSTLIGLKASNGLRFDQISAHLKKSAEEAARASMAWHA